VATLLFHHHDRSVNTFIPHQSAGGWEDDFPIWGLCLEFTSALLAGLQEGHLPFKTYPIYVQMSSFYQLKDESQCCNMLTQTQLEKCHACMSNNYS